MKSISQKVLRNDAEPHPIVYSIRQVCADIDAAQSRFEQETDADLIEASIYELQSLRAKYRYFLRLARSEGVMCNEKAHLWNE
jgi:hypothetical protein